MWTPNFVCEHPICVCEHPIYVCEHPILYVNTQDFVCEHPILYVEHPILYVNGPNFVCRNKAFCKRDGQLICLYQINLWGANYINWTPTDWLATPWSDGLRHHSGSHRLVMTGIVPTMHLWPMDHASLWFQLIPPPPDNLKNELPTNSHRFITDGIVALIFYTVRYCINIHGTF